MSRHDMFLFQNCLRQSAAF